MIEVNKIYNENCLETMAKMPDGFIDNCITSPPYFGLRDYGDDEQIGLEQTPELYVAALVEVFNEVKRVLKSDGTLFLNLGDSYWGGGWRGAALSDKSGDMQKAHLGTHCGTVMTMGTGKHDLYKAKDLIGIPWMVAFALRASGWYLRQDIIWNKPNPMPESVTDRCTKAHEYIFLLSKSAKYYYDADAIKTKMECSEHDKRVRDGRKRAPTEMINGIRAGNESYYEWANKRSVWTVNPKPYAEAHFAVFPEELIEPCVLTTKPDAIIYDPFGGSGTTGVVALRARRRFILSELSPAYCEIEKRRLHPYLAQTTLF